MQSFMALYLLLVLVREGMAVAGCHSDRDKDHRPRQNCTAAGLNHIPAGMEPSTQVVVFCQNQFSSLSWSSYTIFTDIYEIDLTGNKVPEVVPSSGPVLPSLKVLRLGSNSLTGLPDHSFSACPALSELHLPHNSIATLTDHTFSGLSKLEILDLSYNNIRTLPALMVRPLPAIETLYIEYNRVLVMPDEWFSPKEEVPYLYLSANPWICSCSLDYLYRYLDNYEANVYVRDGINVIPDGESVVCDSPPRLKGRAVVSLEEGDFCGTSPDGDFDLHAYATTRPARTTTTPATTLATTTTTPTTPTTTMTGGRMTTLRQTLLTARSWTETWFRTEKPQWFTRSWYEVFTRMVERSHAWGVEVSAAGPEERGDGSSDWSESDGQNSDQERTGATSSPAEALTRPLTETRKDLELPAAPLRP